MRIIKIAIIEYYIKVVIIERCVKIVRLGYVL